LCAYDSKAIAVVAHSTSTFLVARRSRHKSSAAEKMPLLVGFAHSALRLKALKNRDHLGTPG
jgi:hypothetical protein